MKYFLPDSQDMVDPSFNFETETRSEFRIRHNDDLYAHEVFDEAPFDGMLVSMAIVEGMGSSSSGRYTMPQRHRLRRVGVREFFRLEARHVSSSLETMGDCGAFSYVNEVEPPFPTEHVVNFYEDCGFDYGISIDHVILGFKPDYDHGLSGIDLVPAEWRRRQKITIERAKEFLKLCSTRRAKFEPVGVAQGWSPGSYTKAFKDLQDLGFKIIALGGLVPLKTAEIVSILQALEGVRKSSTGLHLLGISRCEHAESFASRGVTSIDSTSPLRQAFKDERDNYYTQDRTYSAIRIPQVEGNPRLGKLIKAGKIDQQRARKLEQDCLGALNAFDKGEMSLEETLESLMKYEELFEGKRKREDTYREVLEVQPWKDCPCNICRSLGYHVMLFRGAERNRRRGFHNVYVFNRRLKQKMTEISYEG